MGQKASTAATPPPITTFKVIYNDCAGSFGFSKEFIAEYMKRTGYDYSKAVNRLWPHGANWDTSSGRRDPIAIALLEEKGPEWSSGINAFLAIHEISLEYVRYWRIKEGRNGEVVYVDYRSFEYDESCKDIWETCTTGKKVTAGVDRH